MNIKRRGLSSSAGIIDRVLLFSADSFITPSPELSAPCWGKNNVNELFILLNYEEV